MTNLSSMSAMIERLGAVTEQYGVISTDISLTTRLLEKIRNQEDSASKEAIITEVSERIARSKAVISGATKDLNLLLDSFEGRRSHINLDEILRKRVLGDVEFEHILRLHCQSELVYKALQYTLWDRDSEKGGFTGLRKLIRDCSKNLRESLLLLPAELSDIREKLEGDDEEALFGQICNLCGENDYFGQVLRAFEHTLRSIERKSVRA